MLELSYATAFKKAYKKLNLEDQTLTKEVIKKISNGEKLEKKALRPRPKRQICRLPRMPHKA